MSQEKEPYLLRPSGFVAFFRSSDLQRTFQAKEIDSMAEAPRQGGAWCIPGRPTSEWRGH